MSYIVTCTSPSEVVIGGFTIMPGQNRAIPDTFLTTIQALAALTPAAVTYYPEASDGGSGSSVPGIADVLLTDASSVLFVGERVAGIPGAINYYSGWF